jgi:hypothetical protein
VDKLEQLAELANLLSIAERETEFAKNELKKRERNEARLREEAIPLFMAELELRELKLNNGDKITVKQDVYASIPVTNREAAYDWIDVHNFGGIIKTEVSVAFGKGEIEKAENLLRVLMEDMGYEPEFNRSVHPQTLKAFLREQLIAGTDIPLDLFGARPVDVAKVTRGNRKL